MQFQEVVTSPTHIAGVKAVWNFMDDMVLCFGIRGGDTNASRRFAPVKNLAKQAEVHPFVLLIGGGAEVKNEVKGRVVAVVRLSGIYGDTPQFLANSPSKDRLARWPISILLTDVYEIEGYPHLVDNLGFPDLTTLTNAYDLVARQPNHVPRLWESLRVYPLRRKPIPPLLNFDPTSHSRNITNAAYAAASMSSEEGKKRYELSVVRERSKSLRDAARADNFRKFNSRYTCESCGISHPEKAGIFDVHHLTPLFATEERQTFPSELVLLCPTCHRIAHQLASQRWDPLPVQKIASVKMHQMRHPATKEAGSE